MAASFQMPTGSRYWAELWESSMISSGIERRGLGISQEAYLNQVSCGFIARPGVQGSHRENPMPWPGPGSSHALGKAGE